MISQIVMTKLNKTKDESRRIKKYTEKIGTLDLS